MTRKLLLLAAALVILATAISIAPAAALPSVTLIDPDTGTQGEVLNTSITGTSLAEIESISLYGDDPNLPISEGILFPFSDTLMACAFPLALDAPLGACDVVITTASGPVTLTDGFRITTNLPPIASFTATPSTGPAPLTVYFDAAASFDPEDRLYSWVWDFGDGPTGAPFDTGYIFETPGTRMVTLTVTDKGGLTATATQAIEVAGTYGMDAPGTTVTGTQVAVDLVQAQAAGATVQVIGNEIVLTGNGLVTTITTAGVTITGGTYTGEIQEVSVQSEPLPGEFASAGDVQASFTVDLTGLVETSSVSATLTETPGDDATTAFQLAATEAGMAIGEVAYAMEVTHNIPVDSISGATIEMTASAAWVAAQGGADAVRIIRYSEGVATILETTGVDLGNGMFRFTALSPGFSLFGLAGLEPLNQPPGITSISPATGTPGESVQVTLTGASLGGVTSILLGDDPTRPIAEGIGLQVSETQVLCTFPLPQDAPVGFCDVVVTDSYGQSVILADAFEIMLGPIITIVPYMVTSVSPNTGIAGETLQNVVIEGNGWFLPGEEGAKVILQRGPDIIATGAVVDTTTTLRCDLTLPSTAVIGAWDVIVIRPDGPIGVMGGAFTILPPPNTPPIAGFIATPATGPAPLAVSFDASASSDAEGAIASYTWDFGDGTTGSGVTAAHTFTTPGTRMVTLTVTDAGGLTDTETQAVEVTTYESATYAMDLPGTTVLEGTVAVDTAQAEAAGTTVTISGNEIVLAGNGLITTITTGGVTDADGTITGEIQAVSVQNEPVPGDFATAGAVQASFTVDLTGLVEGTSVSATLTETPGADATAAFGLAATEAGMAIGEVAYAMEVTHDIPGDSISGATIEMTASAAWVTAQGGMDAVRIIRYSEGIATILPTTGVDIGGEMFRFTALSPGFSLFGLAGLAPLSQNQPPSITSVTVPVSPVQQGTAVSVSAAVSDADVGDTITATWDWGDGTTSGATSPAGTVTGRTISGLHTYAAVGVYTVSVTVTDGTADARGEAADYVVVYDPNGGFVTGGGWIASPDGAYTADPALTGKATFGFVSKYQKGATVPTGQTQFEFQTAGFAFHSTAYEWLVLSGPRAQYKGSGTVNGAGDYGFLLTAIDGQVTAGGGIDRFRLKVWDWTSDTIVYDTQVGAEDDAETATVIGGGSIVVHKK